MVHPETISCTRFLTGPGLVADNSGTVLLRMYRFSATYAGVLSVLHSRVAFGTGRFARYGFWSEDRAETGGSVQRVESVLSTDGPIPRFSGGVVRRPDFCEAVFDRPFDVEGSRIEQRDVWSVGLVNEQFDFRTAQHHALGARCHHLIDYR